MSETAKRRLREVAESDSPIEALRELVAQVEALVALAREVVVIEGDVIQGDVTFSQQLMCAVERGQALVELADERRTDPSSCTRAAQRWVQQQGLGDGNVGLSGQLVASLAPLLKPTEHDLVEPDDEVFDVEALKLAMGGVERLSRMSTAELVDKSLAPLPAKSTEEALTRLGRPLPPGEYAARVSDVQARLVDGQRYYLVHFEVLMPIESEDSASAEDNIAEAKRRAGLCAEMVDEYMGSGSNADPYFYRTRVASVEPFNGELPWEEDELPAGYFVTVLSPGVIQVTGPEFRQTWPTRGECVRAARDHARDGTVVSPNDDVE